MNDRAEKLDIPSSNPRDPNPTQVTLKFDDPLEKDGKFGPYWIYTVEHGSEDRVIFASKALHEQVVRTGAKRGDAISILKFGEKQDTRWDVERVLSDDSDEPFVPAGQSGDPPFQPNGRAPDNAADPAATFEEHKARYEAALEQAKLMCEQQNLQYTVSLNAMGFTLLQMADKAGFDLTKK